MILFLFYSTCVKGKFSCEIDPKLCGQAKCPGDQVWSTSGVECLKTCETLHVPCMNLLSVAGCRCLGNTVWDSKLTKCVNASECPCHYNGRTYKQGEYLNWDCNRW